MIRIHIDRRALAGLDEDVRAFDRALVAEIRKEGRVLAGLGRDQIRGRIRRRGTAVRGVRRSAPGEPPLSFTDTLARRIGTGRGRRRRDLDFYVLSWSPHSHLLEHGTADRRQSSTGRSVGQVAPRPFMAPMRAFLDAAWPSRVETATERALARMLAR